MIERLQQVLTRIEQFPPELEEIAVQLEGLTEPFDKLPNTKMNRTSEKRRSFAGAWRDVAWDDETEAFDRMRYATPPTPPIEL